MKIDARWLQIAVLTTYALVAREFFYFERSHWLTLGCVVWAATLDFLVGRLWFGKARFPLSSLIAGFACSLLIDSQYPWIYFLAVTLSILSKTLITSGGRHIFNPACFGVTVILIFFHGYATGTGPIFSGVLLPTVFFACLGTIVGLYARQGFLIFSWIGWFLVFAAIRHWSHGTPYLLAFGPALSPAFLLFSFHMISDPATSPAASDRVGQFAFAGWVALFDAILRLSLIPYGNFYSLMLVSAFLPLFRRPERAWSDSGSKQAAAAPLSEPSASA